MRSSLEGHHGTGADIKSFDSGRGGDVTRAEVSKTGVSLASDSNLANFFAQMAHDRASNKGDTSAQTVYPLLLRPGKMGTIGLGKKGELDKVIAGGVLDAWDAGYNTVKLDNYKLPYENDYAHNYLVRDPSQIRSRFTAFDSSKKNSANLLASALLGMDLVKEKSDKKKTFQKAL